MGWEWNAKKYVEWDGIKFQAMGWEWEGLKFFFSGMGMDCKNACGMGLMLCK